MPPLFYDPHSREIIEASNNDARDLAPHALRLGHLLLTKEFDYESISGSRIPLSALDAEQGLQVGRRITEEIEEVSHNPVPFTQEMVRRLNLLGVFPDFNYIRKNFGTLGNFTSLIGARRSEQHNSNAAYDDLSYVECIEKIITAYTSVYEGPVLQKPITRTIIESLYTIGLGPSRPYVERRLGGVSKINEYLGFPDVKSWDDISYLRYGADILRYNGANTLTVANIDALASKNLGPYTASIKTKFGSFGNFKSLAQKFFEDEQNFFISHGYLPRSSTNTVPEEISQEQLRQHIALVSLLKHYLPDESTIKDTTTSSVDNAIRHIQKHNPRATFADIEITAMTLRIFDDIWPKHVKYKRPPLLADCKRK